MWVHSYRIVPPQPTRRLDAIRALLTHEHTAAQKDARTWASRLVLERRATRILIVSDSADQRAVDHRLADEVRRLQATFTLTVPVEISLGAGRGTTAPS